MVVVVGVVLAKILDFIVALGPGYKFEIAAEADNTMLTVYQPSDTPDKPPFHVHIDPTDDLVERLTVVMTYLEGKVRQT